MKMTMKISTNITTINSISNQEIMAAINKRNNNQGRKGKSKKGTTNRFKNTPRDLIMMTMMILIKEIPRGNLR